MCIVLKDIVPEPLYIEAHFSNDPIRRGGALPASYDLRRDCRALGIPPTGVRRQKAQIRTGRVDVPSQALILLKTWVSWRAPFCVVLPFLAMKLSICCLVVFTSEAKQSRSA